ncbi:hypothetical protein KJ708_01980 [bacterium]|nr:hypothetical protein [bacterium]MBU1918670.1 hypothetical protein [bacterium]
MHSIDSGTAPSGNGATEEGSTETELEPSTPPISIMTPSLVLPETIVYQETEEGGFPIVGQAGVVADFDAGDQIMVSTEDLGDVLACFEAPSIVRNAMNQLKNMIISEAHAETGDSCDDDSYTYCPIEADGSFSCQALPDLSTDTFYFAIVDSECQFKGDEVYEDQVLSNFLYVADNPTSIGLADEALVTIAGSNGVRVADDEGTFRVGGVYEDGYLNFTANGTKITYGSIDELVGVMSDTAGVQMLNYVGDEIMDSTETATDANALSYTFMKPINGILYYGFEQVSSTEAYLMYATTQARLDDYPEMYNQVVITDDDTIDADLDGTPETLLHATKVLGWDSVMIGADRWTVVAFEDASNIRMRIIQNNGDGSLIGQRLGGLVWKTTTEANVKDVVTYYDNDSDEINFAVLDDSNSKVYIGSYLTDGTRTLSTEVSVGTNPVAMKYSAESGKLYVLNQSGQSVSIISLMSDATTPIASPTVDETILLSAQAEGKTVTFVPTSMTIKDNKLIVGDSATKALILVDIAEYEVGL